MLTVPGNQTRRRVKITRQSALPQERDHTTLSRLAQLEEMKHWDQQIATTQVVTCRDEYIPQVFQHVTT